VTDRRTDRQNCYINIARQYADARQSYICALIGPCSFFSNFCVFCTLFLTRAGLRVLGLVRLCVICLFSSILSELRLVVSDASIDSSLCWRVMCRVRRYTRQSLITQCQYGLYVMYAARCDEDAAAAAAAAADGRTSSRHKGYHWVITVSHDDRSQTDSQSTSTCAVFSQQHLPPAVYFDAYHCYSQATDGKLSVIYTADSPFCK